MNPKDKLKNTIFWGFILWLFGYVLGMIFFIFVPMEQIGLYVLPLMFIFTLWVLFKKIKREEFSCYIGLAIIWTIMAIVLDYGFIVMLFDVTDYYKPDIYIYYILTFILPIIVGFYKFRKKLFHNKSQILVGFILLSILTSGCSNCERTEADILRQIDEANFCDKDSDCLLLSLGCPFGCYKLVNRNSDHSLITEAIKKYNFDCTRCVYDCDRDPTVEEIKCEKNKCIDIRYR